MEKKSITIACLTLRSSQSTRCENLELPDDCEMLIAVIINSRVFVYTLYDLELIMNPLQSVIITTQVVYNLLIETDCLERKQ